MYLYNAFLFTRPPLWDAAIQIDGNAKNKSSPRNFKKARYPKDPSNQTYLLRDHQCDHPTNFDQDSSSNVFVISEIHFLSKKISSEITSPMPGFEPYSNYI